MSETFLTRFKCDGCGKEIDCKKEDLKVPGPNQHCAPGDAHSPHGWLWIHASSGDEWAKPSPKTITLSAHACSAKCAINAIHEFTSTLEDRLIGPPPF